MWFASPSPTVTRYPVRWLIGLLTMGALLLAGCNSDDDSCNITDARVSQANSVFRIFEVQGADCFNFEGGLFGPNPMMGSTSPTRLCFTEVQAEAQPPIARFMTDPADESEPNGEGETDGAASCNYTYDVDPNRTIPCPLCDIIVNATNINPGGTGSGTMELHLAANREPATLDDPPLRSTTVPVTVGTNAQCNVTSINGVAVVQDTAN